MLLTLQVLQGRLLVVGETNSSGTVGLQQHLQKAQSSTSEPDHFPFFCEQLGDLSQVKGTASTAAYTKQHLMVRLAN